VNIKDLPLKEILMTLVEHTKRFEQELSFKNFAIMKKHFKAYVHGFNGAKELRMKLMGCNSAGEIEKVIRKFLFWSWLKNLIGIGVR
jgi:tRNA-dihydrouridine synthase